MDFLGQLLLPIFGTLAVLYIIGRMMDSAQKIETERQNKKAESQREYEEKQIIERARREARRKKHMEEYTEYVKKFSDNDFPMARNANQLTFDEWRSFFNKY